MKHCALYDKNKEGKYVSVLLIFYYWKSLYVQLKRVIKMMKKTVTSYTTLCGWMVSELADVLFIEVFYFSMNVIWNIL